MSEPIDSSRADESVDELKSHLGSDDPRLEVERRCLQAGIGLNWISYPYSEDSLRLRVEIPNGKSKRIVLLNNEAASRFLVSDFEFVKFLGRYEAVHFTDSSTVEAMLSSPNVGVGSSLFRLPERLPGVEVVESVTRDMPADDEEDHQLNLDIPAPPRRKIAPDSIWRVRFDEAQGIAWTAEIGTATDRFIAATGGMATRRPTLKLGNVNSVQHADAVRVLERIANAIFFELDLRYNALVMLSVERSFRRPYGGRIRRQRQRPTVPQFQYQQDALSLYLYARSAQGLPLLQYLAYYQVLEYYFPAYARREVLDRLRNQLKDARFQVDQDSDLNRLIAIMGIFGKGYGNEREQLKATIRACAEEDQIRDFVTEGDERAEQYFTGASAVKGLRRLTLNDKSSDLRDQAALRIYDLRCRIVHTKDDPSEPVPELLLPFSPEADSIGLDIDLLKFLAQKALIANAQPMRS